LAITENPDTVRAAVLVTSLFRLCSHSTHSPTVVVDGVEVEGGEDGGELSKGSPCCFMLSSIVERSTALLISKDVHASFKDVRRGGETVVMSMADCRAE